MTRRNFVMLAGGGSVAMLVSRMPAIAGPDNPTHAELVDAYAEYLRTAKGILDIRTFHRSGSGSMFLDVVVVSAGFTAEQMGDFHIVCEKFTKALLSKQPWDRYRSLVNVHAVFVGDESVASSRVKASGYDGHVMSCDNGMAVEYARYAANAAATVVIHNSGHSCGGTGVWGVVAVNKSTAVSPFVPIHELGHGLAGLGDEYIQRNTPFEDDPKTLWNTVNVTAEPNPKLCKWHYWTQEEWPGLFGPTKRPRGTNVANFEGAGWVKGIYRPEEACFMRGNRDAFCVVCNETMEANVFRYIDLFKLAEPAAEDVVLWKGEQIDLRIAAIDLLQRPPEWVKSRLGVYLDGEQVASSDRGEVSFHFPGAASAPGIYHLGANVNVQSEGVRQDFGFLSRNRSWRVTVLPCAKPTIVLTPRVEATSDGVIDVPIEIKHEQPSLFALAMAHAPAGAVLEDGRFKWKPSGMMGSWRIDFTAMYGQQHGVTEFMEIHVTRPDKGENTLEVSLVDRIDATAGKQVALRLKAVAKDGGHLLFQPVDVLAGVDMNRDTGALSWTPLDGQAGPQRMRFRVYNGLAMREVDVHFWVRRAATPSPVSYSNRYIPQTLEALKQLKQSPIVYRRLFETVRLLRDRYEQIYQKALADAKSLYEELGPKLRNNCLQELHLHAWELVNKPDILKWMRAIADSEKSEQAGVLLKRLDEIDGYNAERTKTDTA